MEKLVEVNFLDIEKNDEYIHEVESVLKKCFEEENLVNKNLYINVILTNPVNIQKINKQYRNIDKETDVLSFPMFEKEEMEQLKESKASIVHEVMGDIIISIERVYKQADEYGHAFQREFAYMLVHGFYHLMGYDHIEVEDKKIMRQKEEDVLTKLNITRV